jgi:glyoxylase-like metal-dependent hydrolase (beta-lactamase superfamily II)
MARKAAGTAPRPRREPRKRTDVAAVEPADASMAAERPDVAAPADAPAAGERLLPPEGGATVRMYRTGHGDCFLLAFSGKSPGKPSPDKPAPKEPSPDRPVYVLIDCGYKPGSPKHIGTTPKEIGASIRQATGGHIDVAVITHEHQDHVNAITATNFKGITIGEAWLAWTENPTDGVANRLRTEYNDKLLGLLAARNRLAADGDGERARELDKFLALELGDEEDEFAEAAESAEDVESGAEDGSGGEQPGRMGLLGAKKVDPENSRNKLSMKLFKDLARDGVRYILPHEEIMPLPGAPGVRVFALGPPREPEKLEDLDPTGDEEFHALALSSASAGNYFAAAARAPEAHGVSPFAARYAVPMAGALADPVWGDFFTRHYGGPGAAEHPPVTPDEEKGRSREEAADNPEWRRIDKEWLYSAERLALDMGDYTNNASLVLAFELGRGGRVLLFAADAQRGNWVSWGSGEWKDGGATITARDLLSRTVLYKVGHHGSHNATLNGVASGEHANLGWMAHGEHGREFTAMITAVRSWAIKQNGWDHPLQAIKDALMKKASGRVFQTDTDFEKMVPPDGASSADWNRFQKRVRGDRLYFDYEIPG